MNKFKFFSDCLPLLLQVKHKILIKLKAIDAEQFESAKSILKSIIKAKPSNGASLL
jgi:hypothetical protein